MKNKMYILAFVALIGICFYMAANADSTSNVAVGMEQGGAQLTVKTGGQIKVRDTSLFQAHVSVASSATAGKEGYALSPFAGTVSSVNCVFDVAGNSGVRNLTPYINSVAITNGAVTIGSTSTAFTHSTATPTAANTVVAGDVLKVISDGGNDKEAESGHCTLFITP